MIYKENNLFYRSIYRFFLLIQISLFLSISSCASIDKLKDIHSKSDTLQMEVTKLAADLDSFDPKVRKEAVTELGEMDHIKDQHISSTIKFLGKGDYKTIKQAVELIDNCAMGMESSIALLCHALEDTDAKVRIEAADALGKVNKELVSALEPLETLNKNPGGDKSNEMQGIVFASKKAYERISPLAIQIEKFLIRALDDIEPKVKKAALKSITGININEDVQLNDAKFIADSIDKKTEKKKKTETDGLDSWAYEGKESTDSFSTELDWVLDGLDSFDKNDRRFSAAAIERICYEKTQNISEHVKLLRFGDVSSRTDAADEIVSVAMDLDKAVTALCHAMEDIDDEVRAAAATSLGQIVGSLALTLAPLENAPRDLETLIKDNEKSQDGIMGLYLDNLKMSTEKAITIVKSIIDKSKPVLIANIDDENYIVRNSVASALREISPEGDDQEKDDDQTEIAKDSDEKELPLLILMTDLGNRSTIVARKAAKQLGELGPEAKPAIPALIKAINNKTHTHPHYKYVRRDSVAAIGKIGKSAYEAVPVLMSLKDDINYEIRAESAKALGLIGPGEAVPHLIKMLENDKSSIVREAAALALGGCDPVPYLDICYRALFKALKDLYGNVSLNAFKTLAKYEIKNMGRGIIRWKPIKRNFQGYRVCIKEKKGIETNCINTGLIRAFSLGSFPQYSRAEHSIEVMAYTGSKSYKLKWSHIDVTRILQKAAEVEKLPKIKKGKEEVLTKLLEELKPDKELSAGLAQVSN